MPVATDAHASPDGDGLMHRHGPDPPPVGKRDRRPSLRGEPSEGMAPLSTFRR
jgi:hypothetical protein